MRFLWQYFICEYERLRNLAKGTNQVNLNAGMIKDYLVPIPDLEKQKSFERMVEQLDKSKHSAQKALEDLQATQKALIRKYLG